MTSDEKSVKKSQKTNKKNSKDSDLVKVNYKLWDLTNSSLSDYKVATIGIRLLALLFDVAFGAIIFVVITIPFQSIDELSTRALGILGGFIIFSIRAFFQGNSGQSLGQRLLKVKVSGENPMNYSDAIIRNFVCLVFVSIPFAGLILLVNTLINTNSQGWHDKAAKTWVVRKK
jgi:uncharacterized RDD family membrane protein YckC